MKLTPQSADETVSTAWPQALKQAGMGLILDIVPNHMSTSLENAWWRDVIEYGQQSRYFRYFDIDGSRPLTLPFLGDTFEAELEKGRSL